MSNCTLNKNSMKSFFIFNRNSFIFQFVIISIICLVYLFSDKQYISSVTIEPFLDSRVIISKNGSKLSRSYPADYSKQLYLQELANKDSRLEIYREFKSKNEKDCLTSPKMQFHEKNDKSFPISGHFTKITVKSSCVGFVEEFVAYLSSEVNNKVIGKIQKIENEFLENIRRDLVLSNKNDASDLETFFSNRKRILQKVIPLLRKQDDEPGFNDTSKLEFNNDDFSKFDISIPLNRSAAQAELDFISSITDIKQTSMGFVSRTANIERFKVKHDFSNIMLVQISDVEPEKISNRNLFVTLFLIFLTLGVGFVSILLNQIKYHLSQSQKE